MSTQLITREQCSSTTRPLSRKRVTNIDYLYGYTDFAILCIVMLGDVPPLPDDEGEQLLPYAVEFVARYLERFYQRVEFPRLPKDMLAAILSSPHITDDRSVRIRAVARWTRADRSRKPAAAELVKRWACRDKYEGWKMSARCCAAKLVNVHLLYSFGFAS